METSFEYEGVYVTVRGEWVPAQNGGMTDPSWPAHLEDAGVWVGDQCVNDLLAPEMVERIVIKAQERIEEDDAEARMERQLSERERSDEYGI